MTIGGRLDELSKQLEEETSFHTPMPSECNDIIRDVNTYSFKELLDLLDLWDRHRPDFQNKPMFISTLRQRVQFLKHNKPKEIKDGNTNTDGNQSPKDKPVKSKVRSSKGGRSKPRGKRLKKTDI